MSHQANTGEIKGCQVSVAFFLTFTLSKKASPVVTNWPGNQWFNQWFPTCFPHTTRLGNQSSLNCMMMNKREIWNQTETANKLRIPANHHGFKKTTRKAQKMQHCLCGDFAPRPFQCPLPRSLSLSGEKTDEHGTNREGDSLDHPYLVSCLLHSHTFTIIYPHVLPVSPDKCSVLSHSRHHQNCCRHYDHHHHGHHHSLFNNHRHNHKHTSSLPKWQ